MKKVVLVSSFLLCLSGLANSQVALDSVQLQSCIFENFIDGTVRMKSGEVNKAPLNYSSYDQSILFRSNGQLLSLTGLEAVDTVYISDRKFVPVRGRFYEVASTSGHVGLVVSYTSRLRPYAATSNHTGTVESDNNEVSNTVSDVYMGRPFRKNYSLEITREFWLKDYQQLYPAKKTRDFLKVFRESTNEAISTYCARNTVNFHNQADLEKLVDFCNAQ